MKNLIFVIFTLMFTFQISGQEKNNTEETRSELKTNTDTTFVSARVIDPGDGGGGPTYSFYRDRDGDGYGNPFYEIQSTSKPLGYVADNADCNDNDADIYPGAPELIDGKDNDCDGLTDEGVAIPGTPTMPTITKYCGYTKLSRGSPPSGVTWYWQSSSMGTSTSNSSSTIKRYSGATYYLRGRDNNNLYWGDSKFVNYTIDVAITWYYDGDGDGFGDPSNTTSACSKPSNYVSNGTDNCPNEAGSDNGCVSGNEDATELSNENYVFTRTYRKGMTVAPIAPSRLDVIEEVTYFDGLGRPKQQIGIQQAAGDGFEDIVTNIAYDAYGRQDKNYLSYPDASSTAGLIKTGDIALKTQSYYKSNFGEDFAGVAASNSNPYSETRFEASPLNRPLEQGAPGKDWQVLASSDTDHTIKYEYETNSTNEVRLYSVNLSSTYVPSLIMTTFYPAGTLYKSVIKDENWTSGSNNTIEEFKDKQGRVVLKRTYNAGIAHDTYYVYDDYGNITYVLPPKAEPYAAKPDATELAELCYQYKYDKRNRLVEKKIPGKNVEFIVYNNLDQPVLTQDANLKASSKWLYTKYDAFGRVVETGLFTNGSSSQVAMQNALDTYYSSNSTRKAWEEKSTSSTYNYYNNKSYPTSNKEVLTLNYYDNYTFDTAGLKLNAGTTIFDDTVDYATQGLPTGSRVKVLGQSTWITTVNHYDDKGRVIYTASNNAFLSSTDKVKQDLDFMGNVRSTETTHTKGSMNIVTLDNYTYDHVNRLLKHNQQINGGALEVIVNNSYDKLGQLVSKGIGNNDGNSRLQTVDYSYNVREWLKQINNPASLGTDLFGFKMNYNTVNHAGTKLYNGNIAETEWKTQNDNVLRWYRYGYDALNRINFATANSSNYNLSGISYDKNGNILNLTRNGYQGGSNYTEMDVLSYGYSSYSNQLKTVNDSGNDIYGFKDGSSSTTQYTYDSNGNMKTDSNKGITSILYNHLNLPTSVTLPSGIITYIYDATGVKQKKIVPGKETQYAGNYIYENNVLQFFNHPEGYVSYDGGQFNYVYNYLDHLGNVRLSYTDANGNGSIDPSSEIVQENNYYPFGLTHQGYNSGTNGLGNVAAKRYKFGGKELQDESISGNSLDWYDISARNYDPALGRWMNVDPMAEVTMQPYSAFNNNPVYYTDPTGMIAEPPGDYYDKQGNWLYNDGIDDDKVYEVSQMPGVSSDLEGSGELNVEYVGQVENVKMTFTGEANSENPKQADGQLNVIQEVSNGKDYTRGSFEAVGGPWGNGSPENGDYSVNSLLDRGPKGWYNKGMTKDGIGFSLNVDPQFKTGRSLLRIHPDGGKYFGTQGCIGLTCGKSGLTNFKGLMQNTLSTQDNIPLNINILNNPNNNGYGKKTKSNGE